MRHKNHHWRIGEDPPLIKPHSLAKHRVLKAYLERYVSVLTRRPAQDQLRLTLIDGFAGGGLYLDSRTKEECSGSPLLMLEAMKTAEAEAQQSRKKPFHLDVQYFFIEKRPESVAFLRNVLNESDHRSLLDNKITLLTGEFDDHVKQIIEFVKQRGRAGRTIFFLDQFGYTDVPLGTIRTILGELENAEVILTFATDFLIDYLNEDEQSQQILEKIGIRLPSKEIATSKDEREWRRAIQLRLHRAIPDGTKAKFYTPFFIRSADSHRDFWLIHLSGHWKARDVMVGLHWQEHTSFSHFGGSGLGMLGYDQRADVDWTNQTLLPGFYFDETALASSQEELISQLPRALHAFSNGLPFDDFFAGLTNESPVTKDIMRGVLNDLAKQGIVRVRDKHGTARKSGIKHDSDIVSPSSQRRLFLP